MNTEAIRLLQAAFGIVVAGADCQVEVKLSTGSMATYHQVCQAVSESLDQPTWTDSPLTGGRYAWFTASGQSPAVAFPAIAVHYYEETP